MDAVKTAWSRIVPAHGIVALEHEWAREHGLRKARNLPGEDTKGVYILDAYHQIHCLVRTLSIWLVQLLTFTRLYSTQRCFN